MRQKQIEDIIISDAVYT